MMTQPHPPPVALPTVLQKLDKQYAIYNFNVQYKPLPIFLLSKYNKWNHPGTKSAQRG